MPSLLFDYICFDSFYFQSFRIDFERFCFFLFQQLRLVRGG